MKEIIYIKIFIMESVVYSIFYNLCTERNEVEDVTPMQSRKSVGKTFWPLLGEWCLVV